MKELGWLLFGFMLGLIVGGMICLENRASVTDEATTLEVESGMEPHYIEMEVTAYCKNSCCCGRFADGLTASGKPAVGLICAAPPEYPFGTKFTVGGVVWMCEDRGGAIIGNKLDLLFETHEKALQWGRQTLLIKVERN